jgi:hypothetical protein
MKGKTDRNHPFFIFIYLNSTMLEGNNLIQLGHEGAKEELGHIKMNV